MRRHATAGVADAGIERCPGGAGAGRARRPGGRAALSGCGRTRFWSPGRTPGGSGQHELAPRTAFGDEELPEASLRMLAAGALVRHRAGGGGFPAARPPALTDDAVRATCQAFADDAVRATYQAFADVPGVRRLPHRALPAAASTAGCRPPCRDIAEHAAVIARLSVALEPFVADVITTTLCDHDPVVRLVSQPTDHPFGEGPD